MSVWLFPGQGTQKVGMGRPLYEQSQAARAVFEKADAALNEPFSRLLFEGPGETLTQTANAQPAILTVSMAALAALQEAAPELPSPRFAAGHSLGEYSALVAAGGLSFERAVQIVRLRGEAMQRAVPAGEGAMAAMIGGDREAVEALCAAARADEVLSPANFNAPGQVVIAGHSAAVARARELAPEHGLKAIPLKVSAPFHCSLMAPAAEAVRKALADTELSELRFPVVSNVEATPNSDPSRIGELLTKQVDGPVQWAATMDLLAREGCTRALEIGPGKVLAGLCKRNKPPIQVFSVEEPDQLSAALDFALLQRN